MVVEMKLNRFSHPTVSHLPLSCKIYYILKQINCSKIKIKIWFILLTNYENVFCCLMYLMAPEGIAERVRQCVAILDFLVRVFMAGNYFICHMDPRGENLSWNTPTLYKFNNYLIKGWNHWRWSVISAKSPPSTTIGLEIILVHKVLNSKPFMDCNGTFIYYYFMKILKSNLLLNLESIISICIC